jgi:hypothetical protein
MKNSEAVGISVAKARGQFRKPEERRCSLFEARGRYRATAIITGFLVIVA